MLLISLILFGCTTTITPNNNKEAALYNTKLGLAYLHQGDMVRAKSKLLLALQQNPNDPLILDAMGYFLEKSGEVKLAERYYLEAIALAPKMGAAQNNYGAYLCRHGREHQAINHFLESTRDPYYLNVAGAYENAGRCALEIPDKLLACTFFKAAVKHDPGKLSAQRKLAGIKGCR
ncbi:MAG: type IV pilus biogenesis/stability protein PilW [Gammaproteobacteria bacterium]|nr:type IV pilus biogenesis/stability protein PilW [Gammaproteobacteria bacterium]